MSAGSGQAIAVFPWPLDEAPEPLLCPPASTAAAGAEELGAGTDPVGPPNAGLPASTAAAGPADGRLLYPRWDATGMAVGGARLRQSGDCASE